jgi:hypothetical protein
MALEGLEAKQSFHKVLGGICRIFEWLEALVQKNRVSCEVWDFFRGFLMDFSSVGSG